VNFILRRKSLKYENEIKEILQSGMMIFSPCLVFCNFQDLFTINIPRQLAKIREKPGIK